MGLFMAIHIESKWIIQYDEIEAYFNMFDVADSNGISLCVPQIISPKGYNVKWIIGEAESELQLEQFVTQLDDSLTTTEWHRIEKPEFFIRTMNPNTELESNIRMIWMESVLSSAILNKEIGKQVRLDGDFFVT